MTETLADLFTLVQLRGKLLLRTNLSRYTRAARRSASIRLLLTLVAGAFIVGTVLVPLAGSLSGALAGSSNRQLLGRSLAWGLSATTVILFFYALLILVGTLSGDGELKLLLLTPVSPRLILAFRILSVSLSLSPVLLLGVPGLIGMGQRLHLGISYDVAVVAMALVVPVAPVSLGALLVVAVLRWLPPARAKTISTILGVVLGLSFFAGSQLLFSGTAGGGLQTISPPALPPWLPTAWPGLALAEVGLGDAGRALLYLVLTLGFALGLLVCAVEFSARLFATGAATYQEVARRTHSSHRPAVTVDTGGRSWWTGRIPWWPLVSKDWTTLRRDPQRLGALAYPLLLAGFYVYRALSPRSTGAGLGEQAGSFQDDSLFVVLTLATVLIASAIASTAVNREGRSLYLLGLAPLTGREIFLAKWLFCAVPVLVVVDVILAIGIVALRLPPGQAVVAAFSFAALDVALTGAVITVNLIWPRVASDTPRRQASSLAGIVSLSCEMVIGGLVCGLLILSLMFWSSQPIVSVASVAALFLVVGVLGLSELILGSRLLQRLLSGDRRAS